VRGEGIGILFITGVPRKQVVIGFSLSTVEDIRHKGTGSWKLICIHLKLVKDLLLPGGVFNHTLVVVKSKRILLLWLVVRVAS
jgi:hypothetical protein